MASDLIDSNGFYPPEDSTPVMSLVIPIVVTTAKLFRVKDDIPLEEIEKEENIFNLCEEVKGVMVFKNSLAIDNFSEKLFEENPLPLHDKIHKDIFKLGLDNYFEKGVSYCSPGYVYIINYDSMDELFSFCLNEVQKICKNVSNGYIKNEK